MEQTANLVNGYRVNNIILNRTNTRFPRPSDTLMSR